MFAGQRAAVPADEDRGVGDEIPECLWCPGEREVQPDMHAPVTEVTVDEPVQFVLAHQGIEVAQVLRQVLRRDGRVLPAWPGRLARRGSSAETGTVLADAPQRLGRGAGDDGGVETAGVRDEPRGGIVRLRLRVPGGLNE